MIITKNSSHAKMTEEDISIFAQVLEKQMNEDTNSNVEFTENFKLEKVKKIIN